MLRRFLFSIGLVAAAMSVVLSIAPSALTGTNVKKPVKRVAPNRVVDLDNTGALTASVFVTNKGPIPACTDLTGQTCTIEDQTWVFVRVANGLPLVPELGTFHSRETLRNAFVVTGVDWSFVIDGRRYPAFDFSTTPPPNASPVSWAGRWPSTVTCQPGATPPCGLVGDPTVIPGETTTVVYGGWAHGSNEPNGTYIFTFTIHGTVNGQPATLTATSVPIVMT
jgi:hypothetical protein